MTDFICFPLFPLFVSICFSFYGCKVNLFTAFGYAMNPIDKALNSSGCKPQIRASPRAT